MKLKLNQKIKLYDKVFDVDRELWDDKDEEYVYILTGWGPNCAFSESELDELHKEGAAEAL